MSDSPTYTSYLAPPLQAPENVKLAWIHEAVTQGETFIRNQASYSDWDKALATIFSMNEEKIPKSLSKVRLNLTKRLVKEMVATMANLRPFDGFKSENRLEADKELILNKMSMAWYYETFADRKIKEWLQLAAVFGTAYIGPTYQSDFWRMGKGDIALKVYSPKDVLITQLPADRDLQRAYAVTFREEVPINLARAMFPTQAHRIVPDRSNPTRMNKGAGIAGSFRQFLSPVLNRFSSANSSTRAGNAIFPVVDIYHTYILDLSINESGQKLVMGEPGTYWNYTVPSLGDKVPVGRDITGASIFRDATAEDCMIYPFRRLIISTNSAVLRDGPSYWWHSKVPAVKFSFDEWAMEFLGLSLVRDVISVDESNTSLRRAITDSSNARLRPPVMYDDQTIAPALIQKMDPRQPAQAVGVDMTISETPIRPIYPADYFDVPNWLTSYIDSSEEKMKYQLGISDFTALAKAAQIPSADTFEKMMEVAGPLIRDLSRSMEAPIGQLMEMWKGLFFEFITLPRRVQTLGEDGVTAEDFQYPGIGSMVTPGDDGDMVKAARRVMDNYTYKIIPGSLHRITQMDQKLVYVQLQAKGQPIDPWTMAEVFNIPNYGPPPAGTKNVMERWVAWENMKVELGAKVQAKAQQIMAAEMAKMGIVPGMAPGGPGGSGGGGGGEAPTPGEPKNPPGRPNTNEKPGHIESKDGGARSTISTS